MAVPASVTIPGTDVMMRHVRYTSAPNSVRMTPEGARV